MLVILIPFSVAIWTAYYALLSKYIRDQRPEFICRLVALTHAVLICRLVELHLVLGPWPFQTIGEENRAWQNYVLVVSCGFFIFDFAWSVYMGTEGPVMLAHHVVSIFSLLYGILVGYSGSEITATLWGSELSNPFLQNRWFLREYKIHNTPIGVFNDLIFVFVFGFVRMVIGSFLVYLLVNNEKPSVLIKAGGVTFYIISVVWMIQILAFAVRRFGGLKKIHDVHKNH